ncbi:MAG TPA: hypothetical protein VK989_18225 [Polyangia bacterium]|nr:hypothetical protein [Polyangia bacterium]
MVKRRREEAGLVILAALAVALACARTPRLTPRTPASMTASADGLSVAISGLDSGIADSGVVVVARASAASGVSLRAAELASARKSGPCGVGPRRAGASLIALDGAATWQRPVALAGEHELRIDVPQTIDLSPLSEHQLALDLFYERPDGPACLRVPIEGQGDGAVWVAASPWMAGFQFSSPQGLGLNVGRWLGRFGILGVDGAVAPSRATAKLLADVPLAAGFVLEASYAGFVELRGGDEPSGTLRHGPALGLVLDTGRVETVTRASLAGFFVDYTRWWAAGAEPAFGQLGVGLRFWMNPSTF